MANPTMNAVYRDRVDERNPSYDHSDLLTKSNVVTATLGSLLVVIAAVLLTVRVGLTIDPGIASAMALVGVIGVVIFNLGMMLSPALRRGNVIITVIMAALQGLMLGGIVFYIGSYDLGKVSGWTLVFEALMGTIGLFLVAVGLYAGGIVKVNRTFSTFLMFAVAGMGVLYLGNLVFTMITGTNLLYASGPIPIIIGIVAVILATLTLIADLASADEMIEAGTPKKMRWAIAASITSGLVWLYMELLRVLFLFNRD